jgi:hypothetical protein
MQTMKNLWIVEIPKILAPWLIHLKRYIAHVRFKALVASFRNGHINPPRWALLSRPSPRWVPQPGKQSVRPQPWWGSEPLHAAADGE